MKQLKFKLYSSDLNLDKTIRVFLPTNYNKGNNYKVLYMHDGQNIYDKSKWSKSSWEILETFKKNNITNIIVVGIDSEDKTRTQQYVPFSFNNKVEKVKLNKSYAKQYATFIVKYLKPYIDYHFKTDPSYDSTYMVGSSFGAVITAYISSLYKGVFSKLGIFSLASFVINDKFNKFLDTNKIDNKASYFISVGDKELPSKILIMVGNLYINCSKEYSYILKNNKAKKVVLKIYKNHYHSEVCWKKQFEDFLNKTLLN